MKRLEHYLEEHVLKSVFLADLFGCHLLDTLTFIKNMTSCTITFIQL